MIFKFFIPHCLTEDNENPPLFQSRRERNGFWLLVWGTNSSACPVHTTSHGDNRYNNLGYQPRSSQSEMTKVYNCVYKNVHAFQGLVLLFASTRVRKLMNGLSWTKFLFRKLCYLIRLTAHQAYLADRTWGDWNYPQSHFLRIVNLTFISERYHHLVSLISVELELEVNRTGHIRNQQL